jgi:hypothetical protein
MKRIFSSFGLIGVMLVMSFAVIRCDTGTGTGGGGNLIKLGCPYSKTAATDVGTHYLLTISFDKAKDNISANLQKEPNEGGNVNIQQGSILTNGDNWVILEETSSDYRLVRETGGERTGVSWNR